MLTDTIKLLLFDYLRRWKWLLLAFGTVQIAVSGFLPFDRLSVSLTVVLFCGPMLLSLDLAKGVLRVYQSLPILSRELAIYWRWVALGLPVAMFAVTFVLIGLLRMAFQVGGWPSLSKVVFCLAYTFLMSGASFYLLTHLPRSAPQEIKEQVKAGLVGLLWGLSIGVGGLLPFHVPEVSQGIPIWLWVVTTIASIMTCLGWFRAELLVLSHVAPCQSVEFNPTPNRLATVKGLTGPLGLNLMFGSILWSNLGIILSFVVVFFSIQILPRYGWSQALPQLVTQCIQEPSTFFILITIAMITGFRWLMTMRHLRSLPISGLKATSVMGAAFVIPAFLLVAILSFFQVVCGQQPLSIVWFSRAILITAPVLLVLASLLNCGLGTKSFMIVLMLGSASAPFFIMLAPRIPTSMVGFICVGAWSIGAWLLHRVICTSSKPYRQPLFWQMNTPR